MEKLVDHKLKWDRKMREVNEQGTMISEERRQVLRRYRSLGKEPKGRVFDAASYLDRNPPLKRIRPSGLP